MQESHQSSGALAAQSIPEAFAAARDLLSLLVPASPAIQELTATAPNEGTSVAPRSQVPFKGKPLWPNPNLLPLSTGHWTPISAIPPWSPGKKSLELDLEAVSCQSQHHHSSWHYPPMDPGQGIPPMAWPQEWWQMPAQWSFWNPWAFPPMQGPRSRRSYSVASESRALPLCHSEQDPVPRASTWRPIQCRR